MKRNEVLINMLSQLIYYPETNLSLSIRRHIGCPTIIYGSDKAIIVAALADALQDESEYVK